MTPAEICRVQYQVVGAVSALVRGSSPEAGRLLEEMSARDDKIEALTEALRFAVTLTASLVGASGQGRAALDRVRLALAEIEASSDAKAAR